MQCVVSAGGSESGSYNSTIIEREEEAVLDIILCLTDRILVRLSPGPLTKSDMVSGTLYATLEITHDTARSRTTAGHRVLKWPQVGIWRGLLL